MLREFQFQIGTIEAKTNGVVPEPTEVFQFQIGTIEAYLTYWNYMTPTRFNSR